MHVYLGEFLGTCFLIIFGCGVVANVLLTASKGQHGGWISVTTGWGFAVMVGVFIAQATGSSNADINPAVSLVRYMLYQAYPLTQLFLIILSQCLGAFLGATIVWLAYLPHWSVTENPQLKLMTFATLPAIRNFPANLLCEIIGTAVLVIGIGAIFGSPLHNHPIAAGMGPYLVGALVWGIGLSLGGPTGYAINPARDFGPRLAHFLLPIAGKASSYWSYAWVPIVGPLIGAVLATYFWKFFF
jgi:glycerol uptake facilitator protein